MEKVLVAVAALGVVRQNNATANRERIKGATT